MDLIRKFIDFFLRQKRLGRLIVLAFFVGIGISTVYRGSFSPKQRTDLGVFFKAAEMVREGRPLHMYGIESVRHWHYVYSPFLAVTLSPFTQVPFGTSVAIFYLLSFLCLLGTFLLSERFAEEKDNAGWKIALAAFFCLPIFLNTLTRGQLGTLSLFAQAAVLLSYFKGWKVLAGFLLAFAVALKISPLAVLFFYFLFKKEWKLLFIGAASSVLFWIIYPSVAIGFENNLKLLTIWRGLMADGSSITAYKSYLWNELFTPLAGDNQSLYAVITRFVWPTKEIFIARATNWVRWSVSAGAVLALLLLFLKRQKVTAFPVPEKDRAKLLAEYSLYPMVMLIFSPVTQIHHYTSLYFLFLSALLMLPRASTVRKRWLLTGLWVSAALFCLGFVIDVFSYWGMPMWGALFLWGIVLACIDRNRILKN
jgi:hypothetical protein